MHKKDMVDAMLGKIEQAIIRILNNSQSIFVPLLLDYSGWYGTVGKYLYAFNGCW